MAGSRGGCKLSTTGPPPVMRGVGINEMSTLRPPIIDLPGDLLQRDPAEIHEVLVDAFGRYVFWMRESAPREGLDPSTEMALDRFIQLFSAWLTGTGFDTPIGEKFVCRARLIIELCDKHTGDVLHEEILNRGGKKAFMDYFGRWKRLHYESQK
jgi:hypothetical protein